MKVKKLKITDFSSPLVQLTVLVKYERNHLFVVHIDVG